MDEKQAGFVKDENLAICHCLKSLSPLVAIKMGKSRCVVKDVGKIHWLDMIFPIPAQSSMLVIHGPVGVDSPLLQSLRSLYTCSGFMLR